MADDGGAGNGAADAGTCVRGQVPSASARQRTAARVDDRRDRAANADGAGQHDVDGKGPRRTAGG
ncbi:Uncharacterised protein [Mycobacteroides abscessus subsp. abscessus]|nr:Uncharacterised protein [Mycobacteroides abscessus subsp. abscessus]